MEAGLEGQVLLAVDLDTLCQVKGKRIVTDIGMGCGEAALEWVDKDFELRLMKWHKFKCPVGEAIVPVRFTLDH